MKASTFALIGRLLHRDLQALRYLFVGGALFLIDLGIVVALVEATGLRAELAQLIGRGTGALIGYFAHKYVTFYHTVSNPRYGAVGQGSAYILVGVAMLLISPFVLHGCLMLLGGKLVLAKFLNEAVIVVFTYLSLRFVFRRGA